MFLLNIFAFFNNLKLPNIFINHLLVKSQFEISQKRKMKFEEIREY